MTPARETIVQALLTKLRTLTRFTTVEREWKGLDNADQLDKLDALFLIELPDKYMKKGHGVPAKIDVAFDIVLVIKNPDDEPAGSIVNPLLDKVDALFSPNPAEQMQGNRVTLGGLVYDAWIEGTVTKNLSYIGGRASIAVFPLHVRTTNPS